MSLDSLSPEHAFNNDKFNRAHWHFVPKDIDDEICKDINMHHVKSPSELVYRVLGMTMRDINFYKEQQRNPMLVMFEKIRERKLHTCQILCCDPDSHFQNRKCFPIYKVYMEIHQIYSRAADHLKCQEVRETVLRNIVNQERLLGDSETEDQTTYPVYTLPKDKINHKTLKKKIVLTVDFLELDLLKPEQDASYHTGLTNMLENVNQNFTCMLAPQWQLNEKERWEKFVTTQIENCHFIVFVMAPEMMRYLLESVSLNSTSDGVGAGDTMGLSSLRSTNSTPMVKGSSHAQAALTQLWSKISRADRPLAGVVFTGSVDKAIEVYTDSWASQLVPAVFQLPRNMKLLLGYLLHRLNDG